MTVTESSHRRWWRAVAATSAAALALPFVAGAPANAASTDVVGAHTAVVLGADQVVSADSLTDALAAVSAAGGVVVEQFDVAESLVVRMPLGAALPAGLTAVPDMAFSFNAVEAADETDSVNTFRETVGASDTADGSEVTVALVDTGVADVPELTDVTHINVSDGEQGDGLGHGTFLAGLIAADGAFPGVAPGADIVDVQVAEADGSTNLRKVLRGLEAVNDRADELGIDVVTLSLSTGSPLPAHVDPLSRALTHLWFDGLTVVVAAGNDGPKSISAPATNPLLLVAGSLDENGTSSHDDDTLSDFSAFGKVQGIDRPDLVAPGRSLISTRAPGSLAEKGNESSWVGDSHIKGTGTSMSAAVTAGVVAALLGERGDLSPNEVKRVLMGSAYEAPGLAKGSGQGGLDLAAALGTDVADTAGLGSYHPSGAADRNAPGEEDAEAWARFAAAWEAGDLAAAVDAWIDLSPEARKWAADAWAVSVLANSVAMDNQNFEARKWAARKWAEEDWAARKWADDEWVARKWAARKWADDEWSARKWAEFAALARKWANDDWLAYAWSARKWANSDWVARKWADSDWAARKWADEDWAARKWADEDWAARKWAARKWADQDWAARKWADEAWSARKWADVSWDARKWADVSFEARKWATTDWDARKWASTLG